MYGVQCLCGDISFLDSTFDVQSTNAIMCAVHVVFHDYMLKLTKLKLIDQLIETNRV